MNSQFFTNMVAQLESNPNLLAPIVWTPHAELAYACMVNMLNSLPNNSPVLVYLESSISSWQLGVHACLSGNEILLNTPPVLLGAWPYIEAIPTNGGVYLWGAVEEWMQYVGSTVNQSERLAQHVSKITGNSSVGLQAMHKWAKANGGLDSLYWGQIYSTLNLYLDYVQTFPLYELTLGEMLVLKAFTEFLPRLLEQSLLIGLKLSPAFIPSLIAWNNQEYVNFKFKSWMALALNEAIPAKRPIQLKSHSTGELLRVFPTTRMAYEALGVKNKLYFDWKVNNVNGFYCPGLDFKVTANEVGKPLRVITPSVVKRRQKPRLKTITGVGT